MVRATAILIVLLSHARQALVEPDSGLSLTFGGWFGVELFFALSGFLIGTILIKLFDRGISSSTMGRFWFRRWMRTLPAYFFILIFYWAVFGQVQFSDFILLQWPINHNQGIVPVSWSLAVEEWFYIIFPMVALAATVAFKKTGILVSIIAAIAIPLIFRIYQYNIGADAAAIRVNPFRFDGMAYGVLAAYLITICPIKTFLQKYWIAVAFAATTLLLFDFLRYNGARLGMPLPFQVPSWHHMITSYTISGICAALIVIAFYISSPRSWTPLSTVITYISKVSYSLYLWHLLMFSYIIRYFADHRGVGLYILVIVAAIIMSSIPYFLIEVPFMKMRDYLTNKHQKSRIANTSNVLRNSDVSI